MQVVYLDGRKVVIRGGRMLPTRTPVNAVLLIEGIDFEIVDDELEAAETQTLMRTIRQRPPVVQTWGEALDTAARKAG